MKKLLLMAAALGIFSGVYAKKVRFQVDMTGHTVSPNGVHIAGNFQAAAGAAGDWDPAATTLTNGGSGSIYSVIVDIPAGRHYEFKFLNGNSWGDVESVPALSQVGYAATNKGSNENRWYYIDSTANDTTLIPAIAYNGTAPAGMYAVRFALDMQTQAAISPDGIHIAGSLQGWDPAKTSLVNLFQNNKIYEWIAYLAPGSYEFKYVNGAIWDPSTDERAIPGACANSGGNRTVDVVAADIALPVVCFNMCTACPVAPLPVYTASFIVDMSNSDCNGGFDSVTVTGSSPRITSWGDGIRMNPMLPGSNFFVVVVDSIDSGEVQFKFRAHKDGNTSWEGGDNRKWVLSADDTTDLTCFGSRSIGPCPAKPAPSDITFMVDLSNETPDGQGRIYVIGDFTVPQWQSGAIRLTPVVGRPGFYSTTVTVCPGAISYKFMNGDSSATGMEESFPDSTKRDCLVPSGVGNFNRAYTRTSTDPVVLAFVYNSCDLADTSTVGLAGKAGLLNSVRVYPNPASSVVNIDFNDQARSHQVAVTDIAGKVISSFTGITDNRLTIPTGELAKGMLFVTISNNRGESKTVKLLVQ